MPSGHYTNQELSDAQERIKKGAPEEAQAVERIRGVVLGIANESHPTSLSELRDLIPIELVPRDERGLLEYVITDMLDRHELDTDEDRTLIVRVAA